ncbi:restriction endonuclease subunit S [Stutzerimonas frequens]|uniref:Restriction endonuclease subunit S n=1 Tax=Stutzerimonas frequens TaxID=2968969 RepID=A0ABX6XVD8_9GAMM|nr:restriction endonuclease subunit S [Stutzerimonas frequens]MCQ4303829.1 restriction endonuclease subunit S [Stutzerimonas frequens]PNF51539.1 restriction endonuclease subunit S [Stutzerimonas frequens]QPT18020.1 restriction endonuclease subunit S [Stutzerimonas frequens]
MTNLSGANLNDGSAVGPQGEGMDSPSNFPKYPAYKDSGVEWLGTVPEGWKVSGIKFFADLITGITPPSDDLDIYAEEGWPWVRPEDLNDSGKPVRASKFLTDQGWRFCRKVQGGSTLICCIGTIGKLGFVDSDVCTNQQITAVVSRGNGRFFFYAMQALKPAFDVGATGNVLRILNSERLGNVTMAVPDHSEAESIARFLDHETARIDALIEEQQRLIELLKEKRQAVISQAVTKGLDPTVPMKDSGVAWLGEVPAHWDVIRYKLALRVFQGMAFKSSDYVEYSDVVSLRMGNIKKGGAIDLDHNLKYLPNNFSSEYDAYALREGDVVIAMTDMSPSLDFLAVPATIKDSRKDVSYLLNQRVGKLIFLPGVEAQFIKYTLLSSQLRGQLKGRGLGTVQANMSNDDLYCSFLAMPARKEQIDIVIFLDKAVSEIDEMVGEALKVNQLLNERRSALISAAVTGKIDVRGWQPSDSTQVPESAVAEAH